jgi:Mrp family chromosome partitioning ATPase
MGCDHNCSSCSTSGCGDRKAPLDLRATLNSASKVKKVIGVISGKGGVGKSLVTSSMAVAMQKAGYRSAVLDADITGPSIPKAFGIKDKAYGTETTIYPCVTKKGTQVMSINLLLENETDPVLWRGPIIGSFVKRFWTDVIWEDVDYLFVDMPPGTGDVALTVFQSLPVDGIIVVTSPQELVSMIVTKAVKMAKQMNIPILGLVENFSYFHCPDNGKDYEIFGKSHLEEIATTHHLPILARVPIDPAIAAYCDKGDMESYEATWTEPIVHMLKSLN